MIISTKRGTPQAELERIIREFEAQGLSVTMIRGTDYNVFGLVGDTTVLENPQDGQQGWHVIYFQSWDDPVWKNTADSSLRGTDYNAWLTEIQDGLEATEGSGINYVG